MRHRTLGLSLMETLIALGLVGTIVSAVVKLEVGATQFSSQRTAEAQSLGAIKDALGYLGDQVKTAVSIKTSLTLNGQSCAITSTTNPCFGMVVPASIGTNTTTPTNIDTYYLVVYSMESRSTLPAAYKFTDAWADQNTYSIKEYRSVLCQDNTVTPCSSTVPTVAAIPTVTIGSWALVANDLSLTNAAGASVTPFVYDSTNKQFTLNMVSARKIFAKVYYVPAAGTQTMRIQTRNQ